jgi:hypothetical protein
VVGLLDGRMEVDEGVVEADEPQHLHDGFPGAGEA